MKIGLLISIIGLILQPKISTNNFNVEEIFGLSPNEILNYNQEIKVSFETKIYFETGIGYFISYSNYNNEQIGSILFEPTEKNWKINSIYNGSYVPFNQDEKFYVNGEFLKFSEKKNYINTIDSSGYGVTYGNTINKNLYFSMNISNSDYYFYGSSYLNETKILNVPSYMNTQFNNNGCVPTTFAMYLAFLEDNGYNVITKSEYSNLPIKHTDNKTKVDNFIYYLGNRYFATGKYGVSTKKSIISPACNFYLDDAGFGSFETYSSNNYNEYVNAIYNAKNPVHIGFATHSALGIGYREIKQSNGDITRFVLANQAANDSMIEYYTNVDEVETFYFIHK